jgi:hypothetical protein
VRRAGTRARQVIDELGVIRRIDLGPDDLDAFEA